MAMTNSELKHGTWIEFRRIERKEKIVSIARCSKSSSVYYLFIIILYVKMS